MTDLVPLVCEPVSTPATDPLATPLSALLRRAPVTCSPDSPVRLALALMRQENVGSILLTDAEGAPVGMFTLKDLRDRVALNACDIEQAIQGVMTPAPFSLPDTATAFEAALVKALDRFALFNGVSVPGPVPSGASSSD